MTNFRNVLLAAAALYTPLVHAQSHTLDLGAAYTYERTNVLAACSCVNLSGAAAQAELGLTPHISAVAQFDGAAANSITQFQYQLTQVTYTAGLRYTPFIFSRTQPFGELELGGAHVSGSLAPGVNNSFALRTGGGLSTRVSSRLRFIPIQADYLFTTFNNTANNRQNDLQLSAGLLFRLKR